MRLNNLVKILASTPRPRVLKVVAVFLLNSALALPVTMLVSRLIVSPAAQSPMPSDDAIIFMASFLMPLAGFLSLFLVYGIIRVLAAKVKLFSSNYTERVIGAFVLPTLIFLMLILLPNFLIGDLRGVIIYVNVPAYLMSSKEYLLAVFILVTVILWEYVLPKLSVLKGLFISRFK